jgi:hypothetical protein
VLYKRKSRGATPGGGVQPIRALIADILEVVYFSKYKIKCQKNYKKSLAADSLQVS